MIDLRYRLPRALVITLLSLMLINCGGGGGGDDSANSPPTARFTSSTPTGSNSLNVSLNATSSTDSDGLINRYSWDFGDGSSGSGAVTNHVYATAGSYTIELTVTDNNGASASQSSTLNLSEAQAAITLSRPSAGSIQFDGNNSTVQGAINGQPAITEYRWDFGDGNTATGAVVSHSYTGSGAYSATLTVTDSAGDIDSTTVPTTFSVAGTVSPASNTAVDIDVNDPSRQNKATLGSNFETNNNSTEAQLIPNPVLLNGFVNATGAGAPPGGPSNFASDTDTDDYYSVFLLQDQFVSLRVADYNQLNPLENDIDLQLYDNNGVLVRFSESVLENESVVAPADGQYFIRVFASAGVSKYLLNIGSNSFASGARAFGNGGAIIPGEAIVKTRPPQLSAANTALSALPPLTGLSHNASQQRAALMTLPNAPSQNLSTQSSSIGNRLAQQNHAVLSTLAAIKALSRRPDVAYAEPNYQVQALRTPNDSFYNFQWHYPQISLPQAWDITTGTPATGSVVVAVVDTGVILSHQDFNGQLTAGYDFIRSTETSNDGDGIDSDPNDPGDGDEKKANSWHGTHVAGTVAAASNNNVGVAGVAWGAKVMPIRVLGKGGGSSYDVAQGVRFAAGLSNDSGTLPAQPADVINLSLGGAGFSQATQDLYNQIYNSGIIVVAAAGNESTATPSYPASYDTVISVSATDLNNNLAPYSNFGNFIDVAAPGGDASKDRNADGYNDGVLSTLYDDEADRESYAFYEGTSMAAPHVAGVAALMKAVHPGLTAEQFSASLQSGRLSNDIGASGRDNNYGYGLIDALKAVQEAQLLAGGNASGTVSSSPNRIDFGDTATTRTLTLSKVGDSPPDILGVSSTATWLSIDSSNANPDGTGDYLLTADRSGLGDAVYSEHIIVDLDGADNLNVPATLQVQTSAIVTADAGFLFLLLLDADTFEFVQQVDIDLDNGIYPYQFNNVPYGEYVLIGGSDVDNDFVICGVGESCGNYPTNEQPLRIVVDQNLDNLNFLAAMVTEFISSSSTQADSPTGYRRQINRANEALINKQTSSN